MLTQRASAGHQYPLRVVPTLAIFLSRLLRAGGVLLVKCHNSMFDHDRLRVELFVMQTTNNSNRNQQPEVRKRITLDHNKASYSAVSTTHNCSFRRLPILPWCKACCRRTSRLLNASSELCGSGTLPTNERCATGIMKCLRERNEPNSRCAT